MNPDRFQLVMVQFGPETWINFEDLAAVRLQRTEIGEPTNNSVVTLKSGNEITVKEVQPPELMQAYQAVVAKLFASKPE